MSPKPLRWPDRFALVALVLLWTYGSNKLITAQEAAAPLAVPENITSSSSSITINNSISASAEEQLNKAISEEHKSSIDKNVNQTGNEDSRRFVENDKTPSYASLIGSLLSGLVDTTYLEETSHFNRERISERVVHAKGSAAFGVFEVTNLEITKYCKASLFQYLGRKTPVVTRFSNVAGESGYPDLVRDVRGFAVKFYTNDGNWDLVGNNLPVFFISDPINFTPFIHSQKRNPQTHLRDPNAFWDFVALLPESLHTMMMLFSERGIPASVRHMHGYGVNTFKLVNQYGQAFYTKFHWICRQGIKNFDPTTANLLSGLDPDYNLRDLLNNIVRGNFPSWVLKFQVMSLDQAQRVKFNVLDVTKTWPHADFPLHEIGVMTLNRNVDNYFAQVEQLAFSPENMVPGLEASPDKMLLGRMMSYPDAQRYRLGANYADIPINRYTRASVTPTHCDAITYTNNQHCSKQNHYLPMRYQGQLLDHERRFNTSKRFDLSQDNSFDQPRVFYRRVLGDDSKRQLAVNIADHMSQVTRPEVVARVLEHFGNVDAKLRRDIEMFLQRGAPKAAA